MDHPSLKTLFETQAARRPRQCAARCGEESIRFDELNARGNRLARILRGRGVGPDVLVGVCLPRSIDMLVALVGILKSGGAYLPLDPAYPSERLTYMAEDARVGIVLGDRDGSSRARWTPPPGVAVEDLAALEERARAESPDDLDGAPPPRALAYAIYTSGSTGRPKGVMGTQAGMLNRLSWMWERFPFADDDVGCVKTSLSFLDSFWEIFGHLLQGTPVVLVPDDVVKDPDALVRVLEDGAVTRVVLVPSLLRAILTLARDASERLRRVRVFVTSGEALPVDLGRRFRETLPSARLLNLYGASEVSADCTWHDVSRDASPLPAIGVPIDANRVYVLDAALRPVTPGEPGELYVAGVGLARGYLGRPGLTAERFVADPWGPPGTRMFRSGDLARQRADGALELTGRADQQVKIRGFRVEPGEIETALTAQADVAQAAVVAREDRDARRQLVGYVVPHPGRHVDGAALRRLLAERLPEYMVPAVIVSLPSFPLTPSGKLDREALPAPQVAVGAQAPRTPREVLLTDLFAAVLEVPTVGVADSFFDLGGDSVASMDLVSRARAAGLALSPRDVFQHQSVRQIAAALEATE